MIAIFKFRSLNDLISVARLDELWLLNGGQEEVLVLELIASLGLLGSLIVVTDILEEVAGDSILHIIVVLTLGHNPWDVGVGWGKSLGSLGNLVLVLDGIISAVA